MSIHQFRSYSNTNQTLIYSSGQPSTSPSYRAASPKSDLPNEGNIKADLTGFRPVKCLLSLILIHFSGGWILNFFQILIERLAGQMIRLSKSGTRMLLS